MPEYADLPPTQIVPDLLDKGVYHGSEFSFYRVLKAAGQMNHGGRAKAPKQYAKPTSYKAVKANEVWSWDITYLSSFVKGQFYYLYLFEDIEILGDWPSSGFKDPYAARDWVQHFVDWYNQ